MPVRRWDFILIAAESHWRIFGQVTIKYFGYNVEKRLCRARVASRVPTEEALCSGPGKLRFPSS